MLNYHHLRYFWLVAHEGNLTRAAQKISIAQSALSMQIRKLEADLGQALFERQGRRLVLTEAGQITLAFADTIFSTGEELMGTLRQLEQPRRRVFRVGALATLSKNFQLQFLWPLINQSDVELIIRTGTLEDLVAGLEAYEFDVLLTNVAPVRDATTRWVTHPIDRQPVSLVGRPFSAWSEMNLKQLLAEVPLVLSTTPSSIRTGFDTFVNRLGVRPFIVAEVEDMAMLRLVAREHNGLAVVPPIVVKDELDDGVLVEVAKLPGLEETFMAITAYRRFPNPLLEWVLPQSRRSDSG